MTAPHEDRRTSDHPRRSSDLLLEVLITEVQKANVLVEQFTKDIAVMRADIAPLHELAKQIYVAKMASIWGFGGLAVIGGIITWFINLRDHVSIHRAP